MLRKQLVLVQQMFSYHNQCPFAVKVRTRESMNFYLFNLPFAGRIKDCLRLASTKRCSQPLTFPLFNLYAFCQFVANWKNSFRQNHGLHYWKYKDQRLCHRAPSRRWSSSGAPEAWSHRRLHGIGKESKEKQEEELFPVMLL